MDKPLNALFFKDFKNSHLPDIMDEVWLKKVYEPFLLGKRDLIILDAGANIGLTSYYFKDYAKQIYAMEPAKATLEILRKMIEFNKITNITICPYALSNKNGTEKFYHNENTTANNLMIGNDPKDYEEVETVDFDEFMKRNKLTHIDFMKLDCEGSEAKIVMSEGFKKWADKIKVICFEHHDWSGVSPLNFQRALEDLGFTVSFNQNTKAVTGNAIHL